MTSTIASPQESPSVLLVGAGTVGLALVLDHLRNEVDVILADADPRAIDSARLMVKENYQDIRVTDSVLAIQSLPSLAFACGNKPPSPPGLCIESITENLSLKQALFSLLRRTLGHDIILTSNTSNLRVRDVFASLPGDAGVCGLHFFMPVEARPLAELIATDATSEATRAACQSHIKRLQKNVLWTRDQPGFVVNRLLAPYLNQSLLMLEHGVPHDLIHRAAQQFGMPMSPLVLMDTIGLRTAFDSGRVFWQSYPQRMDPAMILPGMVKAQRSAPDQRVSFVPLGQTTGLTAVAVEMIKKYQRATLSMSIEDAILCLAVPMWIEAAEVIRTRVVSEFVDVDTAMRGGLGFQGDVGFWDYFDSLGTAKMVATIQKFGIHFRSLRISDELMRFLEVSSVPSTAVQNYRGVPKPIEG